MEQPVPSQRPFLEGMPRSFEHSEFRNRAFLVAEAVSSCASTFGHKFLKVFDSGVDWAPYVAVLCLAGRSARSQLYAFKVGTIVAALVVGYGFLRHRQRIRRRDQARLAEENEIAWSTYAPTAEIEEARADDSETTDKIKLSWRNMRKGSCQYLAIPVGVFPKVMDVGQFILFLLLYLVTAWALDASSTTDDEGSSTSGRASVSRSSAFLSHPVGAILAICFAPITNIGMTLPMLVSLSFGDRPFIVDYMLEEMPEFVFEQLNTKYWFRKLLREQTVLWVHVMNVCTCMSLVQPVLVAWYAADDGGTAFGDGGGNDLSPKNAAWLKWIEDPDNWVFNYIFGWGQLLPVFYGMRKSGEPQREEERKRKRVREVMQDPDLHISRQTYPLYDELVRNQTTGGTTRVHSCQIYLDEKVEDQLQMKQLSGRRARGRTGATGGGMIFTGPDNACEHSTATSSTLENTAARLIAAAFGSELDKLAGLIDTRDPEDCLNYLKVNLRCASYFGLVLGAFECDGRLAVANFGAPPPCEAMRALMLCFPVYSDSQEEVRVFNDHVAWEAHGWAMALPESVQEAASLHLLPVAEGRRDDRAPALYTRLQNYHDPFRPRLPSDDLFALGEMKEKKKNLLLNYRPFIYIFMFAADPVRGKGKGYGRSLLQHVISLSREKQMPLVLETTTAENIRHYHKYGFEVRDKVDGKDNWVLMVREPQF
ncbi:unnamed protein product [Amoebophrya sp. A120]|nr:unnamed protein product [Amoebophrya sp. A120]|eukprot:GSA120T00022718001.1